jgi:glycine/D-amino acid oxidase-like deaminating enzyme/nitrite reductase/ring-hydroxylating ferredoxin subunit
MPTSAFGATPQTFWSKRETVAFHCPLTENQDADVCVVGAGIAGLSVAYFLASAGKKVAVLDASVIGAGQTTRSSAHLTSALDDRYFSLEKKRGMETARLAFESHSEAISQVERIVQAEGIACDFKRTDGYLFTAPQHEAQMLERELAAAHRAGFEDAELLERSPFPTLAHGPVLKFPRQAQLDPLRYIQGLVQAVVRKGGAVYTDARAISIEGGEFPTVITAQGRIVQCEDIVVATNSPVNDKFVIHTKQAPYTTYCISLKVPKGSVPQCLFWDTADPYHYVRLAPWDERSDCLIVGGEDHKTGQADNARERYFKLEEWARARFPVAGEKVALWSGQVLETLDGLAYIGHNPMDEENVFVVTGDSGMGVTHGTIAGMLLSDLITGRENTWQKIYEPKRKPISTFGTYMQENANVAMQYTDWLKTSDQPDLTLIPHQSGAVMRKGTHLVAVYREENGNFVEMSAVCPHLQGIVHWNSDENTWDCPCHGSRFDARGQVIQGPSNQNLSPAQGNQALLESTHRQREGAAHHS